MNDISNPLVHSQRNLIINNKDESIQNYVLEANDNNIVNFNEIKDLYGLLKVCLIKTLTNKINNLNKIKNILSNDLNQLILTFQNNIHLTGDKNQNIDAMIKENKIINILIYSNNIINKVINSQQIEDIIDICLDQKQKNEIKNYWGQLVKYEEYNSLFERQFEKDLKNCRFDYSLVSLNVLKNNNIEEFKNKCQNKEIKFLYHESKINSNLLILNNELIDSNKKEFCFYDNIDHFASNFEKDMNDDNYGQIIPVNSTFSFIASAIFYDKNKMKLKEVFNSSKSSNELLLSYQGNLVEPDGINIIKIIKNNNNSSIISNANNKKKRVLENKYFISQNYQIFILYTLTLKRNEYYVLWRDPNFSGNNPYYDFLQTIKRLSIERIKINIYYEKSTEEALKFLVKRKYDKVILITSIGKDLSGKRFIDIARKILGFDIIALFFSNNHNHLNWIQEYQNCLYTKKMDIYEEYVANFNEPGLKKLKEKVETDYYIKLKPFSFDFLSYPNYRNEGDISTMDNDSQYIRCVKITNGNSYLCMTYNGEVNSNSKSCSWDITFLNNEITLFSNGYYLDIDEKNDNVVGCPYMIRWNFDTKEGKYYFMNQKKKNNNILSMNGLSIKVNKENIGENELFLLIDVPEEEYNNNINYNN